MGIFTETPNVPIGLGIALCKNPEAMKKYAFLSKEQTLNVISRSHGVESRDEMDAFVEALAEGQIIQ
jgi:hypothetical protein